jgi:hypothetical protein
MSAAQATAGGVSLDERDSGGRRDPGFARMLLATEGRSIPDATIDRVIELADMSDPADAHVRVLSIARVHGVAFGLPNPGLLPTKAELAEQNEIVRSAIKRLKRRGLQATGHVIGTRKATARICEEATRHECQAIVMSADPDRNRLAGDMLWSQEPQRVRRRAKLPVFLVVEEG